MPKQPLEALRFYTELRYPGTADEIIDGFCRRLESLLARLSTDLKSDRYGEFGGHTRPVAEALATAADRAPAHIKVFQALSGKATDDPEVNRILGNIVANVVSDANFAGIADARLEMPAAHEAKFDQGLGGKLIEEASDIAEKIEVLVEGLAKVIAGEASEPFDGAGKILGAIIRDIGLIGKLAYGISGGDEVGQQLEKKLEAIFPRLDGLATGQTSILERIREVDRTTTATNSEVEILEKKLDTLGRLLGGTLVSEPWVVDPRTTVTAPNRVPARGVKEELHCIEDLLKSLYRRLIGEAFECDVPLSTRPRTPAPASPAPASPVVESPVAPGSPPSGSPPASPPPPPPPPVLDARLKKIYVYEEDVFAPVSASDERIVPVRTAAFDLSGWLDLTQLRSNDAVEVELLVSVAGSPYRQFARTSFRDPALYHFSEFAKGENKVSGNDVVVVIRQPQSSDDFATATEIGYQLVVESQ